MITLPRLKPSYARVHVANPDLGKQGPPDAEHLKPMPGHEFLACQWLGTVWPLVLHCFGAIGITALLLCYVGDNHFNVTERRPAVILADGTSIRTRHFSPLQSDINTILSIMLVILRWVVAAWAGPLCWRILFFLMEKTGLQRRDLEWLIGYGFFPPSTHLRHVIMILVAASLTSTLCAQSASPLLTGAITWAPSSTFSGVHSDAFINVSVATPGSFSWVRFGEVYIQAEVDIKAASFVNQAWGRDIEKGALKRVLPSASKLNTNTTIANVTLPYFQVTALEWIADLQAYNIPEWVVRDTGLGGQGAIHFDNAPGMLAILPNSSRSLGLATANSWPFPPPSTVAETGTLVMNIGLMSIPGGPGDTVGACELPVQMISRSFPLNTAFVPGHASCFALARVTYTAGTGMCANCRLSSPSTVQNDSEIVLEKDPMTTEALWIMPNVTANLVLMNTSIPSPWENINDYVAEVLLRSYSGAWAALSEVMIDSDQAPLVSRVYPALPSLQAQLDRRRVYAWLALQLLVTITGILFLCIQSGSKHALIGDTTMVAFDLDTTDAPKNNVSDQLGVKNLLKIKPKEDGWKVVVDARSSPKDP